MNSAKRWADPGLQVRGIICALGVALMLASLGCSPAHKGQPGSHAAAERAPALRINAEAFRITAAVDFPRALQAYGTPQTNLRFASLARDMWPFTDGAQGWSLFLSTALVEIARSDQPVATVAFYHPWSDVMLVTTWTKGEDGKYRIGSADVVLGGVVRGAHPPYPASREWQTTSLYAPEAVAKLNAATAKAFQAGFAGPGPSLLDKLDARTKAAMPVAAAFPLAEFRSELWPLFSDGTDADTQALGVWREVRLAALTGHTQLTGDNANTIAALHRLPPKVRDSIAPVAHLATEKATLVILASRIDPDLFLAMQVAHDGGQVSLRQLSLLSFQSFIDAGAGQTEAHQ
jgi:hypothetical protein